MSRRAHGEGSITESPKGSGHWYGFLDLPPGPDGKRRRKKVSGRTRKEVAAKLDEVRRQLAQGVVTDKRITVGAYLGSWLERRERAGDLAPATLTNYRWIIDLYVTPNVGHVRLDALGPAHVEMMTSAIIANGKSPRTAQLSRNVLRRALRDAEREGLVPRNAAQLARPPRQPRREGRTLSPDQARQLLEAVEGHRLQAAFVVSLMLGLRRGELLGLTWADVDLDAGTLTVRHQLQRQNGALVLVDTKTAGSVRKLNLPRPAVEALRRHRDAHPGLPNALVFTATNGSPVDPDNWRREVYAVTESALGERWSPHELRHTAASVMLAAGVPLKVVSDVLGHSSIRVTADVYGHLVAGDRTAAEAMERALG